MPYTPTVADVAAVIPQRTGDPSGNAQGTFNANTTPTDTQVTAIITDIQSEVLAECGAPPVDGSLDALTHRAISLGTAAQVELSFYPDLTGEGVMAELQRRYERAKTLLRNTIEGGAGAEEPAPVYGFPDINRTDVAPFATTWQTNF